MPASAVLMHRAQTTAVSSDQWASEFARLGFKGVIFDCDGTLVHSAEAHFRSMQTAVQAQGHTIDRAWYAARTGLDRVSLFDAFQTHVAPDLDVARAIDASIASFAQHVDQVTPIPETISLLRHILSRRLGCAVGTNAERDVALQSLSAVGLKDDVAVLVSISDNLRPKPAPDLFEHAAKMLGIQSRDLLVVEDSPQGVTAAQAAGMSVLRVCI